MKFAVGYQIREDDQESFAEIVSRYKEHIGEGFFAWTDMPSGRSSYTNNMGYIDWGAQSKLILDLQAIKKMSVGLDLLLNGNCYGKDAISEKLCNKTLSIIDYLNDSRCRVDVVTTASPAVAYIIKQNYPEIETRASVNMRIGTIKGMQYMAELFDSFYLQRDYNRDFPRIRLLKEWADNNGKGLHLLANSGCMRDCSCQTFHDNIVAHSNEIETSRNLSGFEPFACWEYLKEPKNWVSLLQNTWIRPEDLHNYEPYFTTVKLATRTHALPAMVIDAYVRRRYFGNLLDLFEPGYGPALAPNVIDNSRFPKDWFKQTSACDKNCEKCNYCKTVLNTVLLNSEES